MLPTIVVVDRDGLNCNLKAFMSLSAGISESMDFVGQQDTIIKVATRFTFSKLTQIICSSAECKCSS